MCINFHNNSIDTNTYDSVSEYITNIPKFPESLKIIKEKQEDEKTSDVQLANFLWR